MMNNLQTNENKAGILLFLLCMLFSCHSHSKEEYYENFDLPLQKKSAEYSFSGNYKDYIALQNKYFKIADEKGYDDGKALCYLGLFNLNLPLGEFKKSAYFLKKADSILNKSDDVAHRAMLYGGYSYNNSELKLYDNALYYNDKALASIKKVEHKEMKKKLLLSAYQRRALTFVFKAQYDSAYSNLLKVQKIRDNLITESLFIALYERQNKVDSLSLHVYKVQNIIKGGKESSLAHLYLAHSTMGIYYNKHKRYDEAEKEFYEALELINKLKNTHSFQISIYKYLASLYKEKGDLQKSEYYENLYSIEKSKHDDEMQRTINPAVNKFISDANEAEVKSRRRMWILVSALGILCVIILVFAYRQLKIQKQKKKVLKNEADILKDKIGDQKYDEMITLAKKNDPAFLEKFQKVYPDFADKLRQINPDLETSELTFAALIRLNFSSKEIATYAFIQPTSVQQRKRRLRKRLNIPSDIDLYQFFNDL
ncbi:TPA: tetratricopeptide repeat protein [Elizabethkingia anophelis]